MEKAYQLPQDSWRVLAGSREPVQLRQHEVPRRRAKPRRRLSPDPLRAPAAAPPRFSLLNQGSSAR